MQGGYRLDFMGQKSLKDVFESKNSKARSVWSPICIDTEIDETPEVSLWWSPQPKLS